MNKILSAAIILLFIAWLTLGYGWIAVAFGLDAAYTALFDTQTEYKKATNVKYISITPLNVEEDPQLQWILNTEIYVPYGGEHKFDPKLQAYWSKSSIQFYEKLTRIEKIDPATHDVKTIKEYQSHNTRYSDAVPVYLEKGFYRIITLFVLDPIDITRQCIDSHEGERTSITNLRDRLKDPGTGSLIGNPFLGIYFNPRWFRSAYIDLSHNTKMEFKNIKPDWIEKVQGLLDTLPYCGKVKSEYQIYADAAKIEKIGILTALNQNPTLIWTIDMDVMISRKEQFSPDIYLKEAGKSDGYTFKQRGFTVASLDNQNQIVPESSKRYTTYFFEQERTGKKLYYPRYVELNPGRYRFTIEVMPETIWYDHAGYCRAFAGLPPFKDKMRQLLANSLSNPLKVNFQPIINVRSANDRQNTFSSFMGMTSQYMDLTPEWNKDVLSELERIPECTLTRH